MRLRSKPQERNHNILLSLVVLFSLLLMGSLALADQVTMEYYFEYPQVQPIDIVGQSYDRIIMIDAPNSGNTGQPALPARGAQILLPFGTEVSSIEIILDDIVSVGSGYYIEPTQKQFPLSADPGKVEPTTPDPEIYNSDKPYPSAQFEEIGVFAFRGYQILTLKLQPVQYIATSGELLYYPRLTVVVNTVPSSKENTMLRGLSIDDSEVRAKVDNPEMANSYAAGPVRGSKSYDLLIITTTSLESSFQPLKDYHDTTGIITEIHTTTEIGSSSPDDIRDYIRDRYLNDGIQYVIIGADDDIIPAKDLYVKSDASGYYTEYNMPADVFFGCLDGTYNYDGDSYWGEPTDGEGGGDVDLIAEVFIGRASVGNATEADRFVDKTLWYLTKQHANLQNVVLVGEHLGFGGPAEYANFYLDELVDGSDAHSYTTVGIPSDEYVIDKLYDYDWPGNDWPQSELVTRINNGQHVVNHLGHGSEDYAMKMYNSDVMGDLTNSDLCLVYSQTCLAGHLDGLDCWAEYMNIKTDHGAFAVIMNARYGWGELNSTDGASQRFNREFWDAIFSSAEGKPELGRANHDSKEDNLYRINEDYMRWCYYELNLFGDPSVAMMGVTGLTFNYPNGIPELIMPGEEAVFEVVVSGAGDGVPVSGTGQLHYVINGGSVQTDWMTELSPNHYEATLPSVTCDDILEFYVSAEEAVNGRIFNPSPNSPNQPVIATGVTTVFEDDFETDKGWTVSGGLWARGTPAGGGGQYGNPDPTSGHSGLNVFGYNLNGDYENSMPERHLTSPVIDCSELSGVYLKFWRWLGVEQSAYDHAYIRVSNNGTAWTTIWQNSGTITDNSWSEMEFDISEIADKQATVYVRFTMGTTDGSWQYCGWNIDDIEMTGYECGTNAPIISTPSVPDWTINQPYSYKLESVGGMGTILWSDKYGDLSGTGLSLSSTGFLAGTPAISSLITFTAEVIDDSLQTDEKEFNFTINPHVSISTVTLPDWTEDISYSQQLTVSGGTGTKSWIDKNSDLVGTGLTLLPNGTITGMPPSPCAISFTAQVTDVTGDFDEKILGFTVNSAVMITTDSVSDGTKDAPYSQQLQSAGGTGGATWTDKNGDLSGTGLTLSTNGLLSGTPNAEGDFSFTARVIDAVGSSDEKLFNFTIYLSLSITTADVPNWTVGYAYSFQMEAVGGIGDVTWSDKNGDLDGTGLTISTSGLISGIPTSTGDITFIALVTDESKQSDEKQFTLSINPLLEITTISLPDWTVGYAYSQQLTSTGGTNPITWIDKNGDLVGKGISLSSTGLLSGIPSYLGQISFIASASDLSGDSENKQFTFFINTGIAITTIALPEVTCSTAYSCQIESFGGTGVLTWSDKNGDLDGSGLTLSETGLLSGTPSAPGIINFTALAVDEIGASKEKAFGLTVNQSMVITTEQLPDWTISQPYSQQLEVTGGTGAKIWVDINNDLDGTGLSLDESGLVSGTPVIEGTAGFTARVADDCGDDEEYLYEFDINPAVSISTSILPDGSEGNPYSYQLEAVGGTGELVWSDKYDELNGTGFTLSAIGQLSHPSAEGSISFTAEVVDQTGSSDNRLFSLEINPDFICGDINADQAINIFDVTALINFLYMSGSAPDPMESADVNNDSEVNIFDATYLTTYLYMEGPEPNCP